MSLFIYHLYYPNPNPHRCSARQAGARGGRGVLICTRNDLAAGRAQGLRARNPCLNPIVIDGGHTSSPIPQHVTSGSGCEHNRLDRDTHRLATRSLTLCRTAHAASRAKQLTARTGSHALHLYSQPHSLVPCP